MINEFKELINKSDYKIIWWGQRAHDSLALKVFFNLKYILCCDWGIDSERIFKETEIVSLERSSKIRINYSNDDLKDVITNTSINLKELISDAPVSIMYRSVHEVEEFAVKHGNMKIFSANHKLKTKFDSKTLFRNFCKNNNIKIIDGLLSNIKSAKYSELAEKLGEKFIIQKPFSSSGKGTFLIESLEDFMKFTDNSVSDFISMKYLNGPSLNINAVITHKDILISDISAQIIGIPCLSNNRFGFCGNDYSAAKALNSKQNSTIRKYTEKIASWMQSSGFKGLMGIDFMMKNEEIYCVEINPRFQNSTSFLSMAELKEMKLPLVLFHIMEFDKSLNLNGRFKYEPAPVYGAQVILHNLEGKDLKLKKSLKPGIYRYDGSLTFINEGNSIYDLSEKDEFAICFGIPDTDTVIKENAPILKLHFNKTVLDSDTKTLNNEIELIIKKIYNYLIKGI